VCPAFMVVCVTARVTACVVACFQVAFGSSVLLSVRVPSCQHPPPPCQPQGLPLDQFRGVGERFLRIRMEVMCLNELEVYPGHDFLASREVNAVHSFEH
jgi:hypothetical protein